MTPESRIAWALVAVTATGSALLGSAAPIPPEAREIAAEVAELAGAIEDLDEEDEQEVYRLGMELARADASAGYYAMQEKWDTITDSSVRQRFIQFFGASRLGEARNRLQKRLIDCMNLGVRDAAPLVQVAALRVLKQISLRDFAEDFSGYDAWYASVKGKDANEVLAASAEEWVRKSSAARGNEIRAVVDFFEEAGQLMMEIDASRSAAMRAGWADMLVGWLKADDLSAQAAMRLATSVKFRKKELQDVILPLCKKDGGANISVRCWAIAVMGDTRSEWACEELLGILRASFETKTDLRAMLAPMSRALASIGDARAIPMLIGAAEAEGSPAAMNTVGQYGLGPLTGVRQNESRDASWWRTWWSANRDRYGPKANALDVPSLLTDEERAARDAAAADDRAKRALEAELKDIPAATVSAGYDNDQRYNLIGYRPGKAAPEAGFKLLVVLSDDGTPEHRAWSQRLWRDALGDGWIIAQVVAPSWDREGDEVVWSTRRHKRPGARFTTEELVSAVVADADKRAGVDSKGVYLLGWGSGGHAAYALGLQKKPDVPLAGVMVAISEFKPEETDGLGEAKGRKFYILHGSKDERVPTRHAQVALESLTKSGARAHAELFDGGHEWPKDYSGAVKAGLEWLEK
ncbi:MAG: alpha/beta hydrolase [Phycisphaerales bacterium]